MDGTPSPATAWARSRLPNNGSNTNALAPEVVLASLSVLFGSTRALKRDGGYRCESPKLGVKYHTKRVTVTANSYPVQILKIKIFRLHPQALL